MKKRRTLIIAMLLVASMALGIGYAAISQNLYINGTGDLTPNSNLFAVVFKSASIVEHHANEEVIAVPEGGQNPNVTQAENVATLNFDVYNLKQGGDHAKVTATIVNNSPADDLVAVLKKITVATPTINGTEINPDDLSLTCTIVKGDVTVTDTSTETELEEIVLAKGETASITVTLTLKNTITEDIDLQNANITLTFDTDN